MNQKKLKLFIQEIVEKSNELKNKYTDETNAKVNYACIFSQNQKEFDEYKKITENFGKIVKETVSGPLFQIEPLNTVAGTLQLLKIRLPDITRPELGDADFSLVDYAKFKNKYLTKKGFKLIEREHMEMIELMDKTFNVRVYFSHPPLDKQLGIL